MTQPPPNLRPFDRIRISGIGSAAGLRREMSFEGVVDKVVSHDGVDMLKVNPDQEIDGDGRICFRICDVTELEILSRDEP